MTRSIDMAGVRVVEVVVSGGGGGVNTMDLPRTTNRKSGWWLLPWIVGWIMGLAWGQALAEPMPVLDQATGEVINLVELEPGSDWQPPADHEVGEPGGQIGDTWDGTRYVPPPEPEPEDPGFQRLTRAQFFQAMVIDLRITKPQVQAVIDAMPEGTREEKDARASAQIRFDDAQTFDRDDPLLNVIATELGVLSEDIDAAWLAAPDKYPR